LKRQTLANRVRRREGRKEDASRTAGKMLALQMRRRAQQEMERERMGVTADSAGDELGDNVVYFGEVDMKPEERKRKFRRTDQYHLPNLDFPLE
jgi:DNA excision repair protein ERCC-5